MTKLLGVGQATGDVVVAVIVRDMVDTEVTVDVLCGSVTVVAMAGQLLSGGDEGPADGDRDEDSPGVLLDGKLEAGQLSVTVTVEGPCDTAEERVFVGGLWLSLEPVDSMLEVPQVSEDGTALQLSTEVMTVVMMSVVGGICGQSVGCEEGHSREVHVRPVSEDVEGADGSPVDKMREVKDGPVELWTLLILEKRTLVVVGLHFPANTMPPRVEASPKTWMVFICRNFLEDVVEIAHAKC